MKFLLATLIRLRRMMLYSHQRREATSAFNLRSLGVGGNNLKDLRLFGHLR